MPSALLDRQCRATLRRQDARRAASTLPLQLVRSKDIIAALLRLAYYVLVVLSHRRYPTLTMPAANATRAAAGRRARADGGAEGTKRFSNVIINRLQERVDQIPKNGVKNGPCR